MKKLLLPLVLLSALGASATPQFPYMSLTVKFDACEATDPPGLSTLREMVSESLRAGEVSEYLETRSLQGGRTVCIRLDSPPKFMQLKGKLEGASFEVTEQRKPCNQLMEDREL